MNVAEMLDELKRKAWEDEGLRQELLATRQEKNPPVSLLQEMPGVRLSHLRDGADPGGRGILCLHEKEH